MATFILSRSFLLLLLALLSLFSTISICEAKSYFSFTPFCKNASFESNGITLYGDAKFVDGGSSIQLNDSVSHGGGRVVYKKPIKFFETKSEYLVVFSTFIVFSIFPNRGGSLGFVVFPANETFDNSLIEVMFHTSENFTKLGDSNVMVIVDGTTVPEKIQNFTFTNLEKSKENSLLYAWINYIAGSQFLEVRLSKSESLKPVDPVMFTRIDLSRMVNGKGDREFMVGVNSYGGNFNLHSWSLEARHVPKSMHSYAALMEAKRREEEEAKRREEEEAKRKRRARVWEIVTCFVMTFGSTGLVFFAMIHIWAAFKGNNLVMAMQEECGIKTKEFEYEKMSKADAHKENKDMYLLCNQVDFLGV